MDLPIKMQGLLFVVVALVGAWAEAPAPYPPSGWRPDGPRLELPQKQSESQQDSYLPPRSAQADTSYGAPTDLSVQGLPVTEQTPLFAETPVSGQQYVGARFDQDLKLLLQQLREKEAERQRNLNFGRQSKSFGSGQTTSVDENDDFPTQKTPNTAFGSSWNAPSPMNTNFGAVNPRYPQGNTRFGTQTPNGRQIPKSPTQDTTPGQNEVPRLGTNFRNGANPQTPSEKDEATAKSDETMVYPEQPKSKVNVEVSRQMLTQLPENYPSQLVQLALQQQYPAVPFSQQIGQLQAPVYYQPLQGYSQNLVAQPQAVMIQSFDPRNPASFAAIDTTVAQRQTNFPQSVNQQASPSGQLTGQFQRVQIQPQYEENFQFSGLQYSPNRLIQGQTQAAAPSYAPQQNGRQQTQTSQDFPGFIMSPAAVSQNQATQGGYQDQTPNQPGFQTQHQGSNQPSFNQQTQFDQQPSFLQSGFDVNQRGNGLDSGNPQAGDKDLENDEEEVGDSSPADYPVFGGRVPATGWVAPQRPYGAPPSPQPQSSGVGAQPPTRADAPQTKEDTDEVGGPAVAVATAVADSRRGKNGRLRNNLRNIRPLFTLDKNGELVQLQK